MMEKSQAAYEKFVEETKKLLDKEYEKAHISIEEYEKAMASVLAQTTVSPDRDVANCAGCTD